MAKLIWSLDPLAVSRLGRAAKKPPFSKEELAPSAFRRAKFPVCRRSWHG